MMIRKLMAAAVAVVGLTFGLAPSATAADPVIVSGGMKVTHGGETFCSLATVGTDDQGRKVALSAGHCMNTAGLGLDLYLCPDQSTGVNCGGRGAFIGRTATASTGFNQETLNQDNVQIDYLVVELVADAQLKSTTPNGLKINGIGPLPRPWLDNGCKDGGRTGKTCGVITARNNNLIQSWAFVNEGDSGSPLVVNGKIVGITSHINWIGFNGPFNWAGMAGIMADLNSQAGVVGHGFVPTSNP